MDKVERHIRNVLEVVREELASYTGERERERENRNGSEPNTGTMNID